MNYRLYNDTLCPDLWDKKGETYKLKPEIRKNILQIVKDLNEEKIKDEGVNVKFVDVIIVGSSTNYNWTAYSDIDVHILVDFSKMDLPENEAALMLDGVKSNWNKNHDIQIKGHDLEINFTDKDHKGSVSSVYSVKSDKWIEPPVKEKPTFNKDLIKEKHAQLKKKIDELLKGTSEIEMRNILEKLYNMRQAGLDRKGEFSEENIIFKILRAQGYVDKLKKRANSLYDKEMTLVESLFKFNNDHEPPDANVINGEDTALIGEIAFKSEEYWPSILAAAKVLLKIYKKPKASLELHDIAIRIAKEFHIDEVKVSKNIAGTFKFLASGVLIHELAATLVEYFSEAGGFPPDLDDVLRNVAKRFDTDSRIIQLYVFEELKRIQQEKKANPEDSDIPDD